LYAQVLLAILLGVLVGAFAPDVATNPWMQSLGTGFVKLIKMAIGPIIFCTIVSGIAHVADATKIGRVAVTAIVYFEVISTFALGIGLLVANLVQPGHGFSSKGGNEAAVEGYRKKAAEHSSQDFVLNIIPKTMLSAFAEGEILQVLFVAVIFGFALMKQGDRARSVHQLVEESTRVMFGIIAIVMKAAPIDGLHRRQVRSRHDGQLDRSRGHVLHDCGPLRHCRARRCRSSRSLQHFPLPLLHPIRVVAGGGHLVFRERPAKLDDQA